MRAYVLVSYSRPKAHLAPIRAVATFAQPYRTLGKQELWWMGIVHPDARTRARTQNIVRLRFWRSASSSDIHVSRYGRLCGPAEKFGDALIGAGFNRRAFVGFECDFLQEMFTCDRRRLF